MTLPKLSTPTYDVVIPSSKQKISVRPFLVKEEKILLMALQSGDSDDMIKATKQIINNCVITPDFDVDKLEIYDIEFLLLQLRIFSQGEISKIRFAARENTGCPECSKIRVVDVDLKMAKIGETEGHSKKIKLTESVGLVMKYPSAKNLAAIEKTKESKSVEDVFKVIWSCVDSVYDQDKIYKASEIETKEGVEFIENLKPEQFNLIEKFFSTMPKLKQTINVKCGLCDFQQDFELVGLESFFD